jgi:hypothetical protein
MPWRRTPKPTKRWTQLSNPMQWGKIYLKEHSQNCAMLHIHFEGNCPQLLSQKKIPFISVFFAQTCSDLLIFETKP